MGEHGSRRSWQSLAMLSRTVVSVLFSAGALLGLSKPSLAESTIADRAAAVRSAIEKKVAANAQLAPTVDRLADADAAQQWGNWANWVSWANWANWANWFNWFNG